MAQKGVNLMIFDFKNEIIKALNDSVLPISIKRQVFDEISTQIGAAEEKTIQEELMKYQQELKEEQKKELAENKNSKLKKGENENVKDNR